MSTDDDSTAVASHAAYVRAVTWNEDGLVPAIAQDAATGEILMLAWMNRDALAASCDTGYATYWSRSRASLWRKGESSGHTQRIVEIRLDCDGDSVLLRVKQNGGIACHTGRRSCFYQVLEHTDTGPEWNTREAVVKNPDAIYS